MFFLSAFLQFFVVSRALQLKKALLCFKYAQMCRHLTHIFRYVVCYVISTLCVVYDKLFFYSFSLNLLVCACSTTPGMCLSLSAFNGTHQTNHTTNERWHSKFSYGKVFLSFFPIVSNIRLVNCVFGFWFEPLPPPHHYHTHHNHTVTHMHILEIQILRYCRQLVLTAYWNKFKQQQRQKKTEHTQIHTLIEYDNRSKCSFVWFAA